MEVAVRVVMSKRFVLTALSLGIIATAPTRVRASTEGEAVGYGGTSAGGWICGPVGRANYGGVGARVRMSQRPAPFGGTGFTGEGAAAVEYEKATARCTDTACIDTHQAGLFGAHARTGYQWEVFGFEAGATAFQGYHHENDTGPSTGVFPDAQISIGSPSVARGVIGVGSPTVTTLRRPGGYLGADVMLDSVELQARAGVYRSGPALFDDANTRLDVAAYVPVAEPLSLRVGGAFGGNDAGYSGEGSVGLRGSL
jgi:hypothetical protein